MELLKLTHQDLAQFKSDMQTAFQLGAEEGGYPVDEQILPEKDIDRSLNTPGRTAYKAVLNGEIVGGAIVVTNRQTGEGHLDFLYTKHGVQGKGVGKFIWFTLEKLHPEIKLWKTITPYFEKRNIHFYVNVCGFHITQFFNSHHPDPDFPQEMSGEEDDEMFAFEKVIK